MFLKNIILDALVLGVGEVGGIILGAYDPFCATSNLVRHHETVANGEFQWVGDLQKTRRKMPLAMTQQIDIVCLGKGSSWSHRLMHFGQPAELFGASWSAGTIIAFM